MKFNGGIKMEHICQSCGMIMHENNFGNNQDGSRNKDYCHYCFPNGSFGKDETMEEIKYIMPYKGTLI